MKLPVRSLIVLFLCINILLSGISFAVSADESGQTVTAPPAPVSVRQEPSPETAAEDISSPLLVTAQQGFSGVNHLFDKSVGWWQETDGPSFLTLSHEGGIGSLYIMFASPYGHYSVTNEDSGLTVSCGENNFMHDYLDLTALFGTAPNSVTLSFEHSGAQIREVYAFTTGEVPSFVQKWEAPKDGKTDLVLFSTHGDDEHLFFAGILPYYGVEKDYQVQVVYLTDHHNNGGTQRMMEMLNGLWNVGLDTYPVFGPFEDFYLEDKTWGYIGFQGYGWSKDDLLGFVVENIRRFKPIVAVGHDFAGEYGHVQHIVYADLLSQAIELSMDPNQFPESAEKYGTWDVPKTYFHLYKENEIVLDWDRPGEKLGGRTPFEVSVHAGFESHRSQMYSFMWYYYGYTKAAQLPLYNPCYYGLYRTTVGEDVEKNDFFENVMIHAELDRIAEEKRQAEEAQRKAEEEARLKAEEEARIKAEEEAARQTELEAQQAEQLRAEAAQQKNTVIALIAAGVLLAAVVASLFLIRPRKK